MPDPGLTDLIAAHTLRVVELNEAARYPECNGCDWVGGLVKDHAVHLASVVERHTNGRIADLEARIAEAQSLCNATGRYNAARQKHWNIRVFACDVLAALKGRAALEGEQQ